MKHSTTAHALVAEGTHAVAYQSKEDYRKAARANREAIGLRPEKPDEPAAYGYLLRLWGLFDIGPARC